MSTTVNDGSMFVREHNPLASTNVLVAVLGTALLNSLFLPADASVVFLLPYGTAKHMGWNMRRAATFTGTRMLLEWHATDPHSSEYSASFTSSNGHVLEGAALARARHAFASQQNVDDIWEKRWLDAFAFFVDIRGFEVDVDSVVELVERGAMNFV